MRKHFHQMTPDETNNILSAVRARPFGINDHAYDRMIQKGIRESEVISTITNGDVIEIHNDIPGDIRVLLRCQMDSHMSHVCVVVSLTKRRVITCYRNAANDHHRTINMSPYNWKVDFSKVNFA